MFLVIKEPLFFKETINKIVFKYKFIKNTWLNNILEMCEIANFKTRVHQKLIIFIDKIEPNPIRGFITFVIFIKNA